MVRPFAVRSFWMSASICFLTSGLFNAGFPLFNWPSRIANVLYLLKSMVWSNSIVIFCACAPCAVSSPRTSNSSACIVPRDELRSGFLARFKLKNRDTAHLHVKSRVVYQARDKFQQHRLQSLCENSVLFHLAPAFRR